MIFLGVCADLRCDSTSFLGANSRHHHRSILSVLSMVLPSVRVRYRQTLEVHSCDSIYRDTQSAICPSSLDMERHCELGHRMGSCRSWNDACCCRLGWLPRLGSQPTDVYEYHADQLPFGQWKSYRIDLNNFLRTGWCNVGGWGEEICNMSRIQAWYLVVENTAARTKASWRKVRICEE